MQAHDFYAILDVPRNADDDVIRSAYRKQALRTHPDRALPERKEESTAQFKLVSEAYEVLSDPSRREDYDLGRKHGGYRAGSASAHGPEAGPSSTRSGFQDQPYEDSLGPFGRNHAGHSPFGGFATDPFTLFDRFFGIDRMRQQQHQQQQQQGFPGPFGGPSSTFGFHDPFLANHFAMQGMGFGNRGNDQGLGRSRDPFFDDPSFGSSLFGPPMGFGFGGMRQGMGDPFSSSLLGFGGGMFGRELPAGRSVPISDHTGRGQGAPASYAPQQQQQQQQQQYSRGSNRSGSNGFFSSSSRAFSNVGGLSDDCDGGAGQVASRSTFSTNNNGQIETVTKEIASDGTETIYRKAADGRESVTVNGVPQAQHPLLQQQGQSSRGALPFFSSR